MMALIAHVTGKMEQKNWDDMNNAGMEMSQNTFQAHCVVQEYLVTKTRLHV